MFNNFSILSELIVENRTLAERFLENLSSVYRYVIQNLKRDTVPVSEELDFLRSYLYLIGMRYEKTPSNTTACRYTNRCIFTSFGKETTLW